MLPPFNQNEVTIIDEYADGEMLTRYLHKDQICPVIDLTTGSLGKNCAGLQMIIKDLDLVEATVNTAGDLLIKTHSDSAPRGFNIKDSEHIILWSLYSSAIITYAKCFTDANHRGVKLDVSDFNRFKVTPGRPTLKELHNRVLELRHDWIAHGGKNDLERGKSLALLDPSSPYEREPTVFFQTRYSAIPTPQNLYDLLAVAMSAREIAKFKLERAKINLIKTQLSCEKMEEHIKSASDHIIFKV